MTTIIITTIPLGKNCQTRYSIKYWNILPSRMIWLPLVLFVNNGMRYCYHQYLPNFNHLLNPHSFLPSLSLCIFNIYEQLANKPSLYVRLLKKHFNMDYKAIARAKDTFMVKYGNKHSNINLSNQYNIYQSIR